MRDSGYMIILVHMVLLLRDHTSDLTLEVESLHFRMKHSCQVLWYEVKCFNFQFHQKEKNGLTKYMCERRLIPLESIELCDEAWAELGWCNN